MLITIKPRYQINSRNSFVPTIQNHYFQISTISREIIQILSRYRQNLKDVVKHWWKLWPIEFFSKEFR